MEEGDFLSRLTATFRVEAFEHVEAMSSCVTALRDTPGMREEIVERIYREAHSLKGAARAVNMTQIEHACQSLEDLFSQMKSGKIKVSPELLLGIQEAVDDIVGLLPKPQGAEPAGVESETVRVDVRKLGTVMRRAEELLFPRLAEQQRLKDLDEMLGMLRLPGKGADLTLAMKAAESRMSAFRKIAEQDLLSFSALIEALLSDAREMLMMPFSSVSDAFPRFVREISKELGKKIDLEIRGGEIEIDRRILEEIKEPLIHLLRNAADHGIEIPEERIARMKPPQGRIMIALSQKEGGKVEIAVSDDGAGIDVEKVKASGIRLGFLSPEEKVGPGEMASLLFKSGVTASPSVTDISGRGLGLAIVKEKTEKLGGNIEVDPGGSGMVFRLVLPLTLATFRGVLVRAGGRLFVIPSASIAKAARVERREIRLVENVESAEIEGKAVALFSLVAVLGIAGPQSKADPVKVIVLGREGAHFGFKVDEILGEQEVLVKTLGPQLVRVRNVAGACLLGTGEIVPVLNASDLMKSASARSVTPSLEEEKFKAILVVEDSITSRTLLKGILESAGYRVDTAVDGVDALNHLKKGSFDLVVSDVDMPRMNGFELTARIRADENLSSLPVVLVTALDSREHRERGIEAGANAYIVKGGFDRGNLVETVGRLI